MRRFAFILSFNIYLGAGSVSSAALKVDFSPTGGPVQPGFQGYFAANSVSSSFTTQSFSAFGTTVYVAPTWTAGAVDAAKRMVDRGGNDGTDAEDLLRDWIGTDGRQVGDPMTLTLTGLPLGTYAWKSWHHDPHDQTGVFNATVIDAGGSATTSGINITSGYEGVSNLVSVSTYSATLHSTGSPVRIVFDWQDTGTNVSLKFFVLNGFQLIDANVTDSPLPFNGQLGVSIFTNLQWTGPSAYAPTGYDVYLGTNPSVLANPKYTVTTNRFNPLAPLDYDTIYYWTVIAYDGAAPHASEVWNFRTAQDSQFRLGIDFTPTGGSVMPGWQGYFAQQEVLSSFTPQNFSAFGTTVTVTPTWTPGAVNAASQMYDRGGNDGTDAEALLRDWIGTDAREVGDPLTLTVSGLPAGNYIWHSYHHDTHDQTGVFNVTLNDAAGSKLYQGIDISSGQSDGITNLAKVTQFAAPVVSSGSSINLVFDLQDTGTHVSRVFFLMNAFELVKSSLALFPTPADGATDVAAATDLRWMPPTEFVPTRYELYFGTNANVYSNPMIIVTTNFFDRTNLLALGTTYHWAVDTFEGVAKHAGSHWTFTTALPAAAGDRVVGNMMMMNDNAGWCWYQDEKIIYDPVGNNIVASTSANFHGYLGSTRNADIDATTFNLATGQRTRVIMGNIPSGPNGDDHNMGAVWMRPDGRYLHFYTGHNDATRDSYYRVSVLPHDGGAWLPQSSFDWFNIGNPDASGNITYNNLEFLPNEGTGMGRLYNIGRESQRSPNIAYSDDRGTNWVYGGKLSLTKTASSYSNGYYKFSGNNVNRIDFLATEHHPRDFNNSIYHGYILGGKSYNSFGVVVDTNIFDEIAPAPEDFTPVFVTSPEDGSNDANEYHRAWTTELERDPQGNIYALFTTRYGTTIADSQSGDGDHRLFYARFNGTNWFYKELARMGRGLYNGEQDYTGLGAIHPNNPNLVYVSTPFDPRNDAWLTKHEIFKGVTTNGGTNWQWTQITFNSTVDNLRPAIPEWDATHTAVFWVRGDYFSQQDFDETLVAVIDSPQEGMGLVTYTDASPANTTLTNGAAFTRTGPSAESGLTDNFWHERTWFGNGGNVYTANDGGIENAPMLRTTVTGLAAGTYDVFAYFWSPPGEDWRLSAGLSTSNMMIFRRYSSQQAETNQFAGSVSVLDGPAALYRAYVGRKTVGAGGSIDVFIDDTAGTTAYDGVGVAKVLSVLNVASGTSYTTSGLEEYAAVNNAGTLKVPGGTLNVFGSITNAGMFRLTSNAALSVTGPLVNNGVIDVINWSGTLPGNLVGTGIVLNASSIVVQSASVSSNDFRLTVPGYDGHNYQLQRVPALPASPGTWQDIGSPALGTGSNGVAIPLLFNHSGALSQGAGFYRVVVSPLP